MMIRGLLFLLLFYCASLPAEVYRWVDTDGRIHFSDRPVQGAESVGIRASVPADTATEPSEGATATDEGIRGPYEAFEIVSPDANQTLVVEGGDLPVSLILDPQLSEGHRLEVILDGVSVPVATGSTQFKLTGVGLGTHRLQAQIQDADGALVARTAAQPFHLRQAPAPGALP